MSSSVKNDWSGVVTRGLTLRKGEALQFGRAKDLMSSHGRARVEL